METVKVDTRKNYEALASAIVKQAVKDYEHGRNLTRRRIVGSKGYEHGKNLIDSAKVFFNSQWFQQLTKADGPAMLRKIEENYDKYGKCMPFDKDEDKEIKKERKSEPF